MPGQLISTGLPLLPFLKLYTQICKLLAHSPPLSLLVIISHPPAPWSSILIIDYLCKRLCLCISLCIALARPPPVSTWCSCWSPPAPLMARNPSSWLTPSTGCSPRDLSLITNTRTDTVLFFTLLFVQYWICVTLCILYCQIFYYHLVYHMNMTNA